MPFTARQPAMPWLEMPLEFLTLLETLHEFTELECKLRTASSSVEDSDRLQQLHDQIVQLSAPLLEPESLDDLSQRQIDMVFTHAVCLVQAIARCVQDEPVPLNTAGSETLQRFQFDYWAAPEKCKQIRDRLERVTELTSAEIAAIEAQVSRCAGVAYDRQAISKALRERFALWPKNERIDQAALECFQSFYPQSPLAVGEVKLVICGLIVFFCIPFEETRLTTTRFDGLREPEQRTISDFLNRIQRFEQSQFAHFPVFGSVTASGVSATVVESLATNTGLSGDTVRRHLSHMTAVIPLAEVDKFVVHDIWGHAWQAAVMGYDRLYDELAEYAEPLGLQERSDRSNEAISFGDCFQIQGQTVRFNEQRFRKFTTRLVTNRLPVAMAPVVAELLADLTEFKIVDDAAQSNPETRYRYAELLPSSSRFKASPAKLDLLIQDLEFYFQQATKSLRLWASRPSRQQQTIDQLQNKGADTLSATEAVRHGCLLWQRWLADGFQHQRRWHVRDGRLQVNLATAIQLNFIGVHREILHAYDRIGKLNAEHTGLKSFRDVMLIATAIFFASEPARNLWRIDEWLALKIEPLCERFAMELASVEKPS